MRVAPTPGSASGRRVDRIGDPLDGLINLFDLSLVLAVGLLLAALSSAGAIGLLTGGPVGGAPIPGEPNAGLTKQGQGKIVGTVYRLEDGSYVFAPRGAISPGASGATGATTPQGAVPAQPGVTGGTGTAPTQGTTVPETAPQGDTTTGATPPPAL